VLDSLQKTFRWRSGQLLRWLARRDPDLYGVGEPLFFHHIAKTGGTSLIDAVRRMTLPELGLSERGNLSLDFIQGLVARGLSPGQFIYGHPLVGAASPLRGRCNIVALLRDPKRQIIC
jgi:hypothetical protein